MCIRDSSEPVAIPLSKEDESLLMDMMQYVRDSHDPAIAEEKDLRPAVGIAAIQIGVPKQMLAICIDYEDERIEYALCNAKIVSHSVQNAYLANGEGCLSVEEEHPGHVFRHARITVSAYDAIAKKQVKFRISGYAVSYTHLDVYKRQPFDLMKSITQQTNSNLRQCRYYSNATQYISSLIQRNLLLR